MSRGRQSIDITGQRFNRLVAIRMTVRSSWKPPRCPEWWLWRCDCGNEVEARKPDVMHGKKASCGCLQTEVRIQNNKQRATHGHTTGGKRSPEWSSWRAMHKRCSDPNNKDWALYGGSGITVDPRWNVFESFLADNGPKPSPEYEIDRWPDRDGNYKPGNTRWATPRENSNNRRNNHRIAMAGETHTEAEWCRDLGVGKSVLLNRIERWSPEILTQWVRIRREQNPNAAMGAAHLQT